MIFNYSIWQFLGCLRLCLSLLASVKLFWIDNVQCKRPGLTIATIPVLPKPQHVPPVTFNWTEEWPQQKDCVCTAIMMQKGMSSDRMVFKNQLENASSPRPQLAHWGVSLDQPSDYCFKILSWYNYRIHFKIFQNIVARYYRDTIIV